jgi:hypothetical protein
MKWKPISEVELWDLINAGCERMDFPQRRLWEVIKIYPEKWAQHPYGDKGGGFWVVAVIGSIVVWYNDIEDGFNRSQYSKHGEIDQYFCNQDELECTIQHILNEIKNGRPSGSYAGPPQPIA